MYSLNEIKKIYILNYNFYVSIGTSRYGRYKPVQIGIDGTSRYRSIQMTKRYKKIIVSFNYRYGRYQYGTDNSSIYTGNGKAIGSCTYTWTIDLTWPDILALIVLFLANQP